MNDITVDNVRSDEALLYFVKERENIRLRRSYGCETPYTKDPVLSKYKFTNVRRHDDRVSQWFIEYLMAPHADAPDLWFTLLLARLINWPPTIHDMLLRGVLPCYPDNFNAKLFQEVLSERQIEGLKCYTGVYMTYPTRKNPGATKAKLLCDYIISDVIARADIIRTSVRQGLISGVVEELSQCYGISSFMAGQVAADLTYSDKQLGRALDLYTYAPLGPGSQRGLNYLHKLAIHHAWKQVDFNVELMRIRALISNKHGLHSLTLHDVKNVMCEFSKYCRAILGEGNPKTIYKTETEF